MFPKDAAELDLICSLKELETLSFKSGYHVRSEEDRDKKIGLGELIVKLKQLPQLRFIQLEATDAEIAQLKEGLPSCEIVALKYR